MQIVSRGMNLESIDCGRVSRARYGKTENRSKNPSLLDLILQ